MTQYVQTSCPLYDLPYYSYKISLEQNSYTLVFIYNEKMQMYMMSLKDSVGNYIVSGIGLTPYYPLTFDYVIPELNGYFMLESLGSPSTEYYKLYPENLGQYYTLSYYNLST